MTTGDERYLSGQPTFRIPTEEAQPPAEPLASQLEKRRRGRPARFTPEQRAERAKKSTRAQNVALGVLRSRHEEEYDQLFMQAKIEQGLND